MIEEYIKAILNDDYKALADCFAPRCRYFDYSPAAIGGANYHLYGRNCIEMFFRNKFTFHSLSISDYVIEDESTANFMVSVRGIYLYARAKIERVSRDGLIEVLTVRPG